MSAIDAANLAGARKKYKTALNGASEYLNRAYSNATTFEEKRRDLEQAAMWLTKSFGRLRQYEAMAVEAAG